VGSSKENSGASRRGNAKVCLQATLFEICIGNTQVVIIRESG
jgi:hypothetical protein